MKKRVVLFLALILIAGCNLEKTSEETNTEEGYDETLTEQPSVEEQKEQQQEFYERVKEEYQEKEFTGLPDVCSTIEECRKVCTTTNLCMDFCLKNPQNELCLLKHNQQNTIPGKCSTQDECREYCKQNPNESECGFGRLYDPNLQIPTLYIPFEIKYYEYADWGLWPFCVHGGDHPEGHGGIDFELSSDAKIYASADGTVEYIEGPGGLIEDPKGYGVYVTSGKFAIEYVCLINIQVKLGDNVTQGQFLGDPCQLPEGTYFIHWGVNNYVDQKLECPLPYLDEKFKAALNDMLAESHYPEKSVEPNLCNCEWLPYKKTMKRE